MIQTNKLQTKEFRNRWIEYIHELQNTICTTLEAADGKARFVEEEWQRKPDGTGGGGRTRVIANGNVFEKGGVNTSVVFGGLTDAMRKVLKMQDELKEGGSWFACGLSLVLHPQNPYV